MGVTRRAVGHLHLLLLLLLRLRLVGMVQGLLLLLLLLLPRLVLLLLLFLRLVLLLCLFSLPLLLLPSSLVLVPALPPLPSLRLALPTPPFLKLALPLMVPFLKPAALPFNLLPCNLMPLVQSLVMVDFPLKILLSLLVVAMHFLQGQAKRPARSIRMEMEMGSVNLWGMGMALVNLWGTVLEGVVVVWPEEGFGGRLEGRGRRVLFYLGGAT